MTPWRFYDRWKWRGTMIVKKFTISYVERSFRHEYQTLDLFKEKIKIRKHVLSITRPSIGLDRLLLWTARNEFLLRPSLGPTTTLTGQMNLGNKGALRLQLRLWHSLTFPQWAQFPVPYPCSWYFSSPPFFHFQSILVCFWSNSWYLHKFPSN